MFFILLNIWDYITSSIESIFYFKKRKDAIKELNDFKNVILNSSTPEVEYAIQLNFKDFIWSPDPLNGNLDFVSKPWVTMAKKYGDCDDFANLARYIFKNLYKENHIIVVYSTDGEIHTMFIGRLEKIGRFKLFSNMDYIGSFESIEEASKWIYADRTLKFFLR